MFAHGGESDKKRSSILDGAGLLVLFPFFLVLVEAVLMGESDKKRSSISDGGGLIVLFPFFLGLMEAVAMSSAGELSLSIRPPAYCLRPAGCSEPCGGAAQTIKGSFPSSRSEGIDEKEFTR